VKIDTGAQTSSLHVDNLENFKKSGKPWLRFDIHPDLYEIDTIIDPSQRYALTYEDS